MSKYTTLEILHGLRLPVTRENYIKVRYWYVNDISSYWGPQLEAQLPKDLQDLSFFERAQRKHG